MTDISNCLSIEYPRAKSVVICGDIHGDYNLLVYKLCEQYQMKDTILIVAGDCGFGFQQKGYYDDMVKRNSKRMSKANNWIVFVRGNHDNPAYFDGKSFKHKRFVAIPDFSIVKVCGHTILCVGGAISVDRSVRIKEWETKMKNAHHYTPHNSIEDKYDVNYYWNDEAPFFNETLLNNINERFAIDTVVTHTAPSFCELKSKDGLGVWALEDPTLFEDVSKERDVLDTLYHSLIHQNHPLSHWYYGHFHQSCLTVIDDVMFKMLDIMEFCELY